MSEFEDLERIAISLATIASQLERLGNLGQAYVYPVFEENTKVNK